MKASALLTIASLLVLGDLSAHVSPFAVPERPKVRTFYLTNGTEWILSFPVLHVSRDQVPAGRGGIVRFTPFFNPRALIHWDASARLGFFSGLGIRNLGFIYDVPGSDERFKYRAYTLSLPLGIKAGRMHEVLAFFGYDLDLPFNYREKRYVGGERVDRSSAWFSDRTRHLLHSVMLGVQAPYGINLTLKYTFTNFHNTGFRDQVDGMIREPYAGLRADLVCLSLNWGMHAGRERGRGSGAPAPTMPRS